MGVIKTRLSALEKQFQAMIPPGEEPVTFIFENGERLTFPNGHAAIIWAITNSDKEAQLVTVETRDPSKASLAAAILAVDHQE